MAKFIQLNVRDLGQCYFNVDQIILVLPNNDGGRPMGSKIKLCNEVLRVSESVAQIMEKINS